jgi:hypothetical protein
VDPSEVAGRSAQIRGKPRDEARSVSSLEGDLMVADGHEKHGSP